VKYQDTTDPATYRTLHPIFTDHKEMIQLEKAVRIQFRIVGLYHSIVDSEWSSGGREQTDYFHYIHFVCGGSAQITHGGKPFSLRPGFAYWMAGNTPVIRVYANRYETYVLKFRCEMTEGADLLLDWPGRKPLLLGPWERKRWEREWTCSPLSTNACLALRGQLCLWMAQHFPDLDKIIAHHQQTLARFKRVFDVLEKRLGADLRIRDLAKVHGTSVHAFSMAFAREVGISPKSYLNRRLNQEACRVILNMDCSIKEVANKLRFADEYYFSRFFSKMNGVSPSNYRRSLHEASSLGTPVQKNEKTVRRA
jgi:AraC-like DNA-binding protein